ncbi:Shedu anti-phage system protein SduA domain-containing protein [Hymenobacter sp. YC55]|uniref:Shedu anti-phage system protein SduA domain-containing protein n=1 Tax=Hymenobacter sp. YC55 TaxID=3034019 RepID=UPI0023F98F57|nr:Shedu anti-phage system protein SduA domain-containing protein [Hymenobacter sp. YC55]MDF7810519.1 DUF4263 domain-containing protein [Hymenobacter sp. YC55]
MKFTEFKKYAHELWTGYLNTIYKQQKAGILITDAANSEVPNSQASSSSDKVILYPNMLLVTDMGSHFVAELIGAVDSFNGLIEKEHKERSITRYFGQFGNVASNPGFKINRPDFVMHHLCLARPSDLSELSNRYPQLSLTVLGQSIIYFSEEGSSLIEFSDESNCCMIWNCVIVNKYENLFRCKNVLAALIVKKSAGKPKMLDIFEKATNMVVDNERLVAGVSVVKRDEASLIVAGQFQNMYMSPGIRETTIGEFLHQHPDIIKKVFKTDAFLYEASFDWIEYRNTPKGSQIRPDLMIKRADGHYDIYDLKTALLTKSRVTKGKSNRRRFIDGVMEGVGQLANYREYFSLPQNLAFANSRYGITVSNPKCVLIVGNYDNSLVEEISEASRMFDGIEIIDYDTFCKLFVAS